MTDPAAAVAAISEASRDTIRLPSPYSVYVPLWAGRPRTVARPAPVSVTATVTVTAADGSSVPVAVLSRTNQTCSVSLHSGVRDEFEQAAVGVAEVHARSLAARTDAPHRATLDLHAVGAQMVDRAFDWPSPDEAEIAAAGLHRKPRDRLWFKAGSMDVELLSTEAVHRNTVRLADELRAEDIAVESV